MASTVRELVFEQTIHLVIVSRHLCEDWQGTWFLRSGVGKDTLLGRYAHGISIIGLDKISLPCMCIKSGAETTLLL
jgi:hypothetical protein